MVPKNSPPSRAKMTLFFNKQKRLSLPAPNNIIMDFYGTIAIEDNLAEAKFVDYILSNTYTYVEAAWQDKTMMRIVARLRREQFVALKAGLIDLPIIADHRFADMKAQPEKRSSRLSSPSDNLSPHRSQSRGSANSTPKMVAEHIKWRIQTNNISQITALFMKLLIEHGFNEGHLRIAVYDDVPKQLHDWRQKKFIKLYTFGSLSGEDQKLLLTKTNHGDLMVFIANCLDGRERKKNPQLLRSLAHALRDKTMNIIYITHDLVEAMLCLEITDLRCVILLNRSEEYSGIACHKDFSVKIGPWLENGKLFICNTFEDIHFELDSGGQSCC